MKKTALCLALLGLLALGGQALALICTIDDVPAATLLLPYFEVDISNPNGVATLFSINNASAAATLAHVVVWSDLSVPVLDFNVYLTGYDVQTINLRDIIVKGELPQTAPADQDPEVEPNGAATPNPPAISNQGAFSGDPVARFPGCNGQLPPPPLPADFITHLQQSLRGKPSPLLLSASGVQLCAGRDLGDNIARGYVTVDTVDNCTLRFPGDAGYFGPNGTGDAKNWNILWGDYFFVNPGENFAQGETLVHIEASPGLGTSLVQGNYPFPPAPQNPETTLSGQYTFYGRYTKPAPFNAADNREPLSTNFATRYINGGLFSGGTSLICWRDSKVDQAAFTCPAQSGRPPWFPLNQEGVVIFDEEENPSIPQQIPVSPPPPTTTNLICPAEAQRTRIGGTGFPVPFPFGWLYLNLNMKAGQVGVPALPTEDPLAAQAWVETLMDASGRFSVGFDAIKLDSACTALHFVPNASSFDETTPATFP
jgi:hypothetical protein